MSKLSCPGILLSIDQIKAFDKVEHNYLFLVLETLGFPARFVQWLQCLYAGLSSELLVIGEVTRPFPVTRGLRHGCPLSHMLFVLSQDPFLRSIASSPHITGFPLPGPGYITVSAYADDVILFLKDSQSVLEALCVFSVYEELSGVRQLMDSLESAPRGCHAC